MHGCSQCIIQYSPAIPDLVLLVAFMVNATSALPVAILFNCSTSLPELLISTLRLNPQEVLKSDI